MKRKTTIASVNKVLKERGFSERLFNNRQHSYLYFGLGDTENWKQTAVYVSSANDLSVEEWFETFTSLKQNDTN